MIWGDWPRPLGRLAKATEVLLSGDLEIRKRKAKGKGQTAKGKREERCAGFIW